MAGLTHKYSTSIQDSAGAVKGEEVSTLTGDQEAEFATSIADSGNDVIAIGVDVSTLVSFFITADREVTITENDDGTPDVTKVVAAGVPWYWRTGIGTNPFTVDIVTLKIANASGGVAQVNGHFLTVSP